MAVSSASVLRTGVSVAVMETPNLSGRAFGRACPCPNSPALPPTAVVTCGGGLPADQYARLDVLVDPGDGEVGAGHEQHPSIGDSDLRVHLGANFTTGGRPLPQPYAWQAGERGCWLGAVQRTSCPL